MGFGYWDQPKTRRERFSPRLLELRLTLLANFLLCISSRLSFRPHNSENRFFRSLSLSLSALPILTRLFLRSSFFPSFLRHPRYRLPLVRMVRIQRRICSLCQPSSRLCLRRYQLGRFGWRNHLARPRLASRAKVVCRRILLWSDRRSRCYHSRCWLRSGVSPYLVLDLVQKSTN